MPRYNLGVLPYEPLAAAIGAECDRDTAEALNVTMREVVRWRTAGVPVNSADALAIRLWLHPLTVWGKQWSDAEAAGAKLIADRKAASYARKMARQRELREEKKRAEWAEVERTWWQWSEQQERRAP